MPGIDFDFVVIGQGLAGTTLAWTLRLRGQSVLVVDDQGGGGASRISAGLITPLTGPRLAKTWNWDQFWPAARSFYREVELLLGVPVLQVGPAVRLLASLEESVLAEHRSNDPEYAGLISAPLELDLEKFHAPFGAFQMPAGRLDALIYLERSRQVFEADGGYRCANVDPCTDLREDSEGVAIRGLDVRVRQVICCQGYAAAGEFPVPLAFNPSRGEILTLRIPGLRETRSIHQHAWLAPGKAQDEYLLGSTFDWTNLTTLVSAAGREELLAKLREFVRLPVTVLDQRAAVRPTTRDYRPALGQLPGWTCVSLLNGLGTRGALMAPALSRMLADSLLDGTPIPRELDVQRWFR